MTGRPTKIGVTGTRERLTDAQIRRGTDLLADTLAAMDVEARFGPRPTEET